MKALVGPVLRMGDDIDAIVAAIRDDNPGQDIEVVDRGAYVRVRAPGPLTLTRRSIEQQLGRPYEMREIETLLSSFAGRLEATSESFTWTLGA